jgi:hypothetical protein
VPGNATSNCASETECGGGFSCFGGGGFGQCRKYCDGHDDCGTRGYCLLQVVFGTNSTPVPGAVLCTKSCDPLPLTNNGCPGSPQLGCRLFIDGNNATGNGANSWLTDCVPAATTGGLHDAPCTSDASCAPGHECFTITGGTNPGDRCRQICDRAAPVCSTGTCQAYPGDNPPTIDGKTYGVCN